MSTPHESLKEPERLYLSQAIVDTYKCTFTNLFNAIFRSVVQTHQFLYSNVNIKSKIRKGNDILIDHSIIKCKKKLEKLRN